MSYKLNNSWIYQISLDFENLKDKSVLDPKIENFSLHQTACELFHLMKHKQSKELSYKFVKKVYQLSKKRIEYLNLKFSCVYLFFSALKNLLTIGIFRSSDYLAHDLSKKFLNQLRVKNYNKGEQADNLLEKLGDLGEFEVDFLTDSSGQSQQTAAVSEVVEKKEKILEPSELFIKEIEGFWKNKNRDVKNFVKLLKSLFKGVTIENFEVTDRKLNQYSLTLSDTVNAKFPYFVSVTISKKFNFQLEEKGYTKLLHVLPSDESFMIAHVPLKDFYLKTFELDNTYSNSPAEDIAKFVSSQSQKVTIKYVCEVLNKVKWLPVA